MHRPLPHSGMLFWMVQRSLSWQRATRSPMWAISALLPVCSACCQLMPTVCCPSTPLPWCAASACPNVRAAAPMGTGHGLTHPGWQARITA